MSDTVTVDPADPSKKTSDIMGPGGDDATVSMDMMNAKCLWNDQEFEQGQRISVDGKCYECSFGHWVESDD